VLVQTYKKLDLESPEARDFRVVHMGDPELYSMGDFNVLPVALWPSLEAYSEFKRYFTASQRFLETGAIGDVNKQKLYDEWQKEHDEAWVAVVDALEGARKS
jgi:hypothetical protein